MKKKQEQLGMNPSTAQARLLKDLLFNFVSMSGHKCYRCGGDLDRETFSIEHVTPWLDGDNPANLFFDIDNIAYSHLTCNVKARRVEPSKHGTLYMYKKGCRCDACKRRRSESDRKYYDSTIRRDKYVRSGF